MATSAFACAFPGRPECARVPPGRMPGTRGLVESNTLGLFIVVPLVMAT